MCAIIFLSNSSVVRIIDEIWRWQILHVFSLVCNVLPMFEYRNTMIPKRSTERSFHENDN